MSAMSEQTQSAGIPRHVAIVMDGNGRWAKKRFQPRLMGHRKGVESVRMVIRECAKAGVECLTLFAFSSENWKRPAEEVSGLMSLFMNALEKEADALVRNNVVLTFIGDRSGFSEALQAKIRQVEGKTAQCSGLRLLIAANYGGRWDIVEATRQLATQVAAGTLMPDAITEQVLQAALSTQQLPEPDLFIRTGGEQRISNFLMWQLAYSELYFTEVLWPEFSSDDLKTAFAVYVKRQRRFGMTGDQVTAKNEE